MRSQLNSVHPHLIQNLFYSVFSFVFCSALFLLQQKTYLNTQTNLIIIIPYVTSFISIVGRETEAETDNTQLLISIKSIVSNNEMQQCWAELKGLSTVDWFVSWVELSLNLFGSFRSCCSCCLVTHAWTEYFNAEYINAPLSILILPMYFCCKCGLP